MKSIEKESFAEKFISVKEGQINTLLKMFEDLAKGVRGKLMMLSDEAHGEFVLSKWKITLTSSLPTWLIATL